MKKGPEPSQEALEEMPEINDGRFRRRPGRGHRAGLSAGAIVTVDPEIWPHFGSSEAVNEALRRLVEEAKNAAR